MMYRVVGGLVALASLAGCGANPADIEEIKKGQKDILAKLEALDKAVQQVKTAAPAAAQRPQVDPNKVYTIAMDNAPSKGPKEAKVVSSVLRLPVSVLQPGRNSSTRCSRRT
jgi:outer membrane murein-binding lipoprotein Lpp